MKKYIILLVLGVISSNGSVYADEHNFIDTMSKYIPMTDTVKTTLHAMATPSTKNYSKVTSLVERPLYRAYPMFQQTISHISLGDFPTPIYRLSHIEEQLHKSCSIYLKDDGLTGQQGEHHRAFGGNKIRKLEFLLADALAQGASTILTRGCIGSNHVVATASCAQQLGLRCIALLDRQDVTDVVKRNLLLMRDYNVEMVLNPNREIRTMQMICSMVQHKYTHGDMPYFIPTGGSCPLGAMGYVNAVFELKEQIEAGIMPEPDYIYVAAGSCGTIAGLMVGVRAAGLKTKVIGVAVEPNDPTCTFLEQIMTLLRDTTALLHAKDLSFPLYDWHAKDIRLLFDFSGPDYGVVTQEGIEAIRYMATHEKIALDTTYTGKACAGMLYELATGKHHGEVILFWNTFCAQAPLPQSTVHDLSLAFQQFFVPA